MVPDGVWQYPRKAPLGAFSRVAKVESNPHTLAGSAVFETLISNPHEFNARMFHQVVGRARKLVLSIIEAGGVML